MTDATSREQELWDRIISRQDSKAPSSANYFLLPWRLIAGARRVSGCFVALILRVRSQAFRVGSANAAPRFPQRFRQATFALAGSHSRIYGVARYYHLEHGGADDRGGAPSGASQHEGGSLQLYLEPRGFHSRERLDGGSIWNPPSVFLRDRHVHYRIDPLRSLDEHPHACLLPYPPRLRWGDDGAGRSPDHGFEHSPNPNSSAP